MEFTVLLNHSSSLRLLRPSLPFTPHADVHFVLWLGTMNNCRAGLYSFAPTTTWLRTLGTASPPYLVMLGLILPDSRMLSGIASIGLTLANIAMILPYLRQSLLDSMHASEGAPAHVGGTQGQIEWSPDKSHATRPVDLSVETLTLTSASPRDNEHPSAPLACNALAVKSVCLPVTEQLEYLDVNPEVALLAILPLPSGKTEDDQSPQSDRPPDADATEKPTGSNSLLMREGRSALYIPLPVPDAAEIAFFDSAETLSSNLDLDLEEAPAELDILLEEDSSIEDDELIAIEDVEQSCQLLTADLLGPPGRILGQGLANLDMPVADEYVAYTETKLPLQSVQAERSVIGENEDFGTQRPESLKFIPQSVISRYPSALVVSAGRCFGHRAFGFGRDNQFTPHSLGHNPTVLPGGTIPQVGHIISEGRWRAAFFTEVQPDGQPMGGQTLVFDTILGQDQPSLPEPPTLQDLTTPKKYPSHRRRLGVLARPALRNRRFSARRCRDNENDGSSASDSDSDSDSSDSQYSSGSSADTESMLPLMLGADLLAALDANSESGLNPAGPGRTSRAPLTIHEEFLVSDGSMADISMVMQVSSIDDGADGEAKAPVTLRSLAYEDIQQWASGVVQKCMRQVCRARAPADPLQSPSQASDVCAEKPSGSGTSQCPFSGLHCKLGAGSSGHGPAPRANELPVSLPPTPAQKVPVRNIRDIPEFVPRQRLVSVATGRVEGHWRPSTKSTNIDVTSDAAAKVIARLESQAGFNSRQCLVGVDRQRASTTARGGHRNV